MTCFIVKDRLDAHVAFADDDIIAVMTTVNDKGRMEGGFYIVTKHVPGSMRSCYLN